MSKRAQVSLIFTDEDMYENYIQPLKDSRELSSHIIRCLTACYYREEVRAMIEGYSEEDLTENNSQMQQAQEAINNIQATISLMGFGLDEAESTLQGGIDDFTDIMGNDPTNTEIYKKYAESHKEENSNFDYIDDINIEKFKMDKESQIVKEHEQEPKKDINEEKILSTLDTLVSAVSNLYSSLGVANNPFSTNSTTVKEEASKAKESVENSDLGSEVSVSSENFAYSEDLFTNAEESNTATEISSDTNMFDSDEILNNFESILNTEQQDNANTQQESVNPVSTLEDSTQQKDPISALNDITHLLNSIEGVMR